MGKNVIDKDFEDLEINCRIHDALYEYWKNTYADQHIQDWLKERGWAVVKWHKRDAAECREHLMKIFLKWVEEFGKR
jgi:thiaminase